MLPEAMREIVEGWLHKARNDFVAAEMLLASRDGPPDVVCYHAQQAAEKSIKALLTARGMAFPKTHDLDELLALLPSTSKTRTAVADLAELSDAAVASRYPGPEEDYNRATAQRLLDKATEIRQSVRAELASLGWTP
jgi:HEPN domain-containing protein